MTHIGDGTWKLTFILSKMTFRIGQPLLEFQFYSMHLHLVLIDDFHVDSIPEILTIFRVVYHISTWNTNSSFVTIISILGEILCHRFKSLNL